ncbi:MAG: hypothetical protein KatS3mg051_1519 [Anaerolineae bacterium]|nr:MAG: hypothetical protein KatS3mg051_1519 [Anaerolineae bacterium]
MKLFIHNLNAGIEAVAAAFELDAEAMKATLVGGRWGHSVPDTLARRISILRRMWRDGHREHREISEWIRELEAQAGAALGIDMSVRFGPRHLRNEIDEIGFPTMILEVNRDEVAAFNSLGLTALSWIIRAVLAALPGDVLVTAHVGTLPLWLTHQHPAAEMLGWLELLDQAAQAAWLGDQLPENVQAEANPDWDGRDWLEAVHGFHIVYNGGLRSGPGYSGF